MGVQFSFTPPRVNAIAVLEAAKAGVEHAGAEVVLAASQPLVPVDTGDLKQSGRVEDTGAGAAIIYDATADDGFVYAIKVHEDLTANHPNGGQAKYLEQPLHTESAAVAAAFAAGVVEVLGL